MLLRPEGLLNCVRAMTPAQKAELCELLDPMVPGIQGPQDSYAGRERCFEPINPDLRPMVEMIDVNELVDESANFGRCISEDMMPDELAAVHGMSDLRESIQRELNRRPAGDAPSLSASQFSRPADDDTGENTGVIPERWMRAQERWKRLFSGEIEIPAIRNPDSVRADLEKIEGMLYDKETKDINPARCPCGCQYVLGCRRKGLWLNTP